MLFKLAKQKNYRLQLVSLDRQGPVAVAGGKGTKETGLVANCMLAKS